MSKVSARCVPLLLTPDKKLTRLTLSKANLFIFEADQASFLDRFLTQDESWVHNLEPETKRQSMEWKHLASPPPKKAMVVSSAGKVMSSVFLNAKNVVFSQITFEKLLTENIMPIC